MQKKHFVVLAVFLSVFMFSGCTKKEVKEAINMVPLVGGDEEINEAVIKKDPNLCNKLKGKDELATRRRQSDCMGKVARAMEESTVCFNMKDNEGNTDVKAAERCSIDIAVETKDLSVCEVLGKSTAYNSKKCYSKLAPILKDASICAKAGEGSEWKTCIRETAKASEKIEICDNFDVHTLKAACQVDVAVAKGDASLCERIENKNRKDSCYQSIATKTKDSTLCDKVSVESKKEACRKKLEVISQ